MTIYTITSNETTTTWRNTRLLQMKQPPHDEIHSCFKLTHPVHSIRPTLLATKI
jgi:hypothetical protein